MKVLVVDDSITCRNLYRRELLSGGYEVVEAKDGVDALRLLNETPVDLVVLDIEMPNMDGYEVCERLRSKEFTTRLGNKEGILPVIFVTSNESVEWRVKGFDKGANGFITKGFRPGTLLTNVNEILKPKNPLFGMRVLVVEDSRFLRAMLIGILEEQEVRLVPADSCERAFEMLMHGVDDYDMVITALEMPAMKGDQLCKHVRTDLGLKTLPILVLTESDDREMLLSLFEAGASDYLVKPFEKNELVARIKASLEMVKALKQEVATQLWQKSGADLDAEKALNQAKLATTILHNVANVLNSVFASCYQMSRIIQESKLRQLILAHNLIEAHEDDLGDFITNDAKGQLLPQYLIKSGKRVEEEHMNMAREVEEIVTKINLMKDIIEAQQQHAKKITSEPMQLAEILQDALKVQQDNLTANGVIIQKRMDSVDLVKVKRAALTHVLINLIKNAVEAMSETPNPVLTILLHSEAGKATLAISDTGVGISKAHLEQIFTHGFTTKKEGHGFGLAFCIKAVREMGGQLAVSSEGKDEGSIFTMVFPMDL